MREVAGVDNKVFYYWGTNFVEETTHGRRNGQRLLIVYDTFAGHLSYKALRRLRDDNIIFAGLPAHTSRALQPLEAEVFGPHKELSLLHL